MTRPHAIHDDAAADLGASSGEASDHEELRDAPAGDLRWRRHDRTHVELPIAYPLGEGGRANWEWEAYFFIPQSFRLDRPAHSQDEIYSSFSSYVRLDVPTGDLAELADKPIERLVQIIAERPPDRSVRELQRFACRVRRAAIDNLRAIESALPHPSAEQKISTWIRGADAVVAKLREVMAGYDGADETVTEALSWTDEDISLLIETLLGHMRRALRSHHADSPGDSAGGPQNATHPDSHDSRPDGYAELANTLQDRSVAEARYRRKLGYDSVLSTSTGGLDERDVERFEFRRHTLKRFSSSVLWLETEIFEPGRWAQQGLFALAAGVAMAFAVTATLIQGPPKLGEQLPLWVSIAIIGYAIKDRIKASLQSAFKGAISKYFADRRWRIRNQRGIDIGYLDEHSRIVEFGNLPEDVLAARRITRRHSIEEHARPEAVVWHRKRFNIDASRLQRADGRYEGVLEIFRLELSRWLTHTDDPKNLISVADPDRGVVEEVRARRVYNIGIVYRLRRLQDQEQPWRRVRVVVSRKGVHRIDQIR